MIRLLSAALCLVLLSGCTALMMGGGGGYEPAPDTCTDKQRRDGECTGH
ncbi:MAG TPA: hypothetical protein PKK10_09810 [Woeseiaceae bacterium]|nr:hypothetical protein [Woeseiaceae bacterium]